MSLLHSAQQGEAPCSAWKERDCLTCCLQSQLSQATRVKEVPERTAQISLSVQKKG